MLGIPAWTGWLILALALVTGSFMLGWHERSLRAEADLAKAEELINLQIVKVDQISAQVSAEDEIHQIQLINFTNALIVEVPKYVTEAADAACTLHVGFIRLLNDAASGSRTVSGAAGQPDDAAARIELHTAAASIASNYGLCREERQHLIDLQAWIVAQKALADKVR